MRGLKSKESSLGDSDEPLARRIVAFNRKTLAITGADHIEPSYRRFLRHSAQQLHGQGVVCRLDNDLSFPPDSPVPDSRP